MSERSFSDSVRTGCRICSSGSSSRSASSRTSPPSSTSWSSRIVLFFLILPCFCENNLSTPICVLVFNDRSKQVGKSRLFPNHLHFVERQEYPRVRRNAKFSSVAGHLRLLLTTWDRSYVQTASRCVNCVGNDGHLVVHVHVLHCCERNKLRQVSPCHHPTMRRLRNRRSDHS